MRLKVIIPQIEAIYGDNDYLRQILRKYSDKQLAGLLHLLLQHLPYKSDPEMVYGRMQPLEPDEKARRLRNEVLDILLSRKSLEAQDTLKKIAEKDPVVRRYYKHALASREVRQVLDDISAPPTVLEAANVIQLLESKEFRLIRGVEDLWRAICEVLKETIGSSIGHDTDLLYQTNGTRQKRKTEAALQAYTERRLNDLLPTRIRGVEIKVIREAQETRRRRTDIRIIAPTISEGLVEVVIEIKWSDYRGIFNALKTQLGRKYLVEEGRTHGIYLVGWTGTPANPDNMLERLRHQASKFREDNPGIFISPILLDVSWRDHPKSEK